MWIWPVVSSSLADAERWLYPGGKARDNTKDTGMNIYVGNLSHEVTEADLRQAFEAFGQVASATVMKDMPSGESRGFGFVQMRAQAEAQVAIRGLNGSQLKGQTLRVNEARPSLAPRRYGGRGGGRRLY